MRQGVVAAIDLNEEEMKMDKGIYKNYAIIYPELRMLEEKEEMNNVNQTIKIYKKEKDIDTLLSERMREKGRQKIAMPSITDTEINRRKKIIEIALWGTNTEICTKQITT